ncbi:MAG: DUF192 domain-containing protein [Dethiobacteraceae bacterium]|jgi:uncharacterized membrane protein (UPF0127 family)
MKLKIANTFTKRLVGFMFQRPSCSLLLIPCRSVHTFFCLIDLDLYFLDKKGTVISALYNIKPWRKGIEVKEARMVLEIPSTSKMKFKIGQNIFKDGGWEYL